MYRPTIKATYRNAYAVIYDIGIVLFGGVKYKWLLIATLDGVAYDTILLPPAKYKQDGDTLTIYHQGDNEQFKIVQ